MKQRLDVYLSYKKLVQSRSQAETLIKLGQVKVDGRVVTKPGMIVGEHNDVRLSADEKYVSRAGLKLASVAHALKIDFDGKTVLDVGSSTGGFTDYALKHGAKKVYAVDVGTEQLHPTLRRNKKIELHEKTDIRDFVPKHTPDIVVMDVSFISLREILPHIATLADRNTQIVAMLKPQFEAGKEQVNKGVIKNDSVRRQILKEFEGWSKQYFLTIDKKDSEVHGAKGNSERFYLLKTVATR
jgi:23S rRNA (cytidine1920-2'-O)/16S rRNA (cytidine1409-2'-O)-methyltransferase